MHPHDAAMIMLVVGGIVLYVVLGLAIKWLQLHPL
jgi:hypothetical protein